MAETSSRYRPLLVPALMVVTGTLIGFEFPGISSAWAAAALGFLAACLFLRRNPLLFTIGLAGFCAAVAFFRTRNFHPGADDISTIAETRGIVSVQGIFRGPIYSYAPERSAFEGETDALAPEAAAGGSFVLAVDVASSGGARARVRGKVMVQFRGATPRLEPADRIEIRGRLVKPKGQRNPGEITSVRQREREGVLAVLQVSKPEDIRIVEQGSWRRPARFLWVWRSALERSLERHCLEPGGSILRSLLLGSRETLPRAVMEDFMRAGTIHVLAISGLHVVLLAWILDVAFSLAGLGRRARSVLVIVSVVGYAGLTGFSVSVVRATVMSVCLFGSGLFRRPYEALNALALAALVILLADPPQLFDAGFQLSFVAVTFLLVSGRLPESPVAGASGTAYDEPGPLRQIARFFLLHGNRSWWAWLATAPIVLARFHLATPVSILANFFAIPWAFVTMLGGCLLMVMDLVMGDFARPLGVFLSLWAEAIGPVQRVLIGIPGAFAWSPAISPVVFVLTYGLLLAATRPSGVVTTTGASRPRRFGLLAAATALVLASPFLPAANKSGQAPEVAFLDVGHGLSVVVTTPERRAWVYDAGSISRHRVGARIVAPFLWSRGHRSIDALFVSHPDADHVNGVLDLADRVRIGKVYWNSHFLHTEQGRILQRELVRRGVPVELLSQHETVRLGSSLVRCVWPPDKLSDRVEAKPNNASLVLVASMGIHSFLLTGDLERQALEELAGLSGEIRANLVQLPHHGAYSSSCPEFSRAVSAELGAVSTRSGFASPRTLEEYDKMGTRIWGTDQWGALVFHPSPSGWTVQPFLAGVRRR